MLKSVEQLLLEKLQEDRMDTELSEEERNLIIAALEYWILKNSKYIQKRDRFTEFLINTDRQLIEPFKSLSDRVRILCKKCGHQYSLIPSNLLATKSGCPNCYKLQQREASKELTLNTLKKRSITLLTEFNGVTNPATFKCNVCQHEWATKRIKLDRSCPNCARLSIAERQLGAIDKVASNRFISKLIDTGFTLLTDIPLFGGFCTLMCNKCGTEFEYRRGGRLYCPACKKEESRVTTELKLKNRLSEKGFRLLSKYEDMSTKINIECIICGEIQERLPSNTYRNTFMCVKCYKETYCKTQEQFELEIKDEPYTLISEYISMEKPCTFRCNICEHEFTTEPYRMRWGDKRKGCPKCSASLGERKIMDILNKQGVSYKKEKTFPDLVSSKGGYLRYDFYLEDYNVLIEYDGEQHFIDNEFFDTENLKLNDILKNTYAYEKDIRLVRIPYTEYENIPEILKTTIIKNII